MKPAKPDLAFPSGLAQGTVVLNYRRNPASDFGPYAAAFQRAGFALAQRIADAPADYHDVDAVPVVYLYRQALELYMKGVIVSGRRLFDLADQPFPHNLRVLDAHRLTPLVPLIVSVFGMAGWQWESEIPLFSSEAALHDYLASLETVDLNSFSFRYPVDKQGQANLPPRFNFNVLDFAERIALLLEHFDAALMGLDTIWQKRVGNISAC